MCRNEETSDLSWIGSRLGGMNWPGQRFLVSFTRPPPSAPVDWGINTGGGSFNGIACHTANSCFSFGDNAHIDDAYNMP